MEIMKKVAKKNFSNFHGEWHCNLINKILRYHTVNLLTNRQNDLHDEIPQLQDTSHLVRVHNYKDYETLQGDFESHLPVAFVEHHSKKYAIKIRNMWCELRVMSYHVEKCGHYYFTVLYHRQCTTLQKM